MSALDLVIVGAGAAGIAAARRARELGLRFRLLEAKSRIGGRAFTDETNAGAVWDRGAHWLHSADENPLMEEAKRLGHPFIADSPARNRRVHLGDRWASEAEADEYAHALERPFEQTNLWGAQGVDRPASDAIDPKGRWARLQAYWFRAIDGGAPEALSSLGHFEYSDSGENWPLERGYGALIEALGQDLPVSLETAVQEIRIDDASSGVIVRAPDEDIHASAVVVTVSTNILRAGRISFQPGLPENVRQALDAVPTGGANKVAFRFSRNVFDMPATSHAVFQDETRPERPALSFQIRPFGQELALAYFGADEAERLERAGPGAMTEEAASALEQMFGKEIWQHCLGREETAWCTDPHTLGAYSYRKVGVPGDPRAVLREPIANRIFLAGEATHPKWFSTVHGAWESGIAAVDMLSDLCMLGNAS